MSPPQVDLQAKPVMMIEGTERANTRFTRKACIVVSSGILALLIIAATTFGAIAYRHHLFSKNDYKTTANVDGVKVPEHIHVDYRNELIYVSNNKTDNIDGLNALHNYDRKLLAFLDLTVNKCFLERLDETFDEGLKFWSSHSGTDRLPTKFRFDFTPTPINPRVLKKFAGDVIADHCRNVTSHWMINIRPFVPERLQKRRAAAAVAYCCRGCYSGSVLA